MTFLSGNFSQVLAQMASEIRALRLVLPQQKSDAVGIGVGFWDSPIFYKNSVYSGELTFPNGGTVQPRADSADPPNGLDTQALWKELRGTTNTPKPYVIVPTDGTYVYRQWFILDEAKPFDQTFYCNGKVVLARKNYKLDKPVRFPFFVDTLVDSQEFGTLKIEAESHTSEPAILRPFLLIPSLPV